MNENSTARLFSVHTPLSMRTSPPANARKSENQELHFSNVFNPLTAQQILSDIVKQLMSEISGHTVVTSKLDQTGISLVLSSPDYQISVMYNNLKPKINGNTIISAQ